MLEDDALVISAKAGSYVGAGAGKVLVLPMLRRY
jgi:hypothetical protein